MFPRTRSSQEKKAQNARILDPTAKKVADSDSNLVKNFKSDMSTSLRPSNQTHKVKLARTSSPYPKHLRVELKLKILRLLP